MYLLPHQLQSLGDVKVHPTLKLRLLPYPKQCKWITEIGKIQTKQTSVAVGPKRHTLNQNREKDSVSIRRDIFLIVFKILFVK